MMNKRYFYGFTLVELLVSITLLSMIMLLGTWSFSIFINKWDGRLGYFSKHISQAKDHILLGDVVSAITPHLINANNNISYYFQASKTEVKAASHSAIFHVNTPVFVRLSVETYTDGSKYLLYQEAPLVPFNIIDGFEYTHEKILIQQANILEFSVLGWSNASEKIISEDPLSGSNGMKPIWRSQYNSITTNIMPLAIRIYWNEGEIEIPLVNDQGFWRSLISQSGVENE